MESSDDDSDSSLDTIECLTEVEERLARRYTQAKYRISDSMYWTSQRGTVDFVGTFEIVFFNHVNNWSIPDDDTAPIPGTLTVEPNPERPGMLRGQIRPEGNDLFALDFEETSRSTPDHLRIQFVKEGRLQGDATLIVVDEGFAVPLDGDGESSLYPEDATEKIAEYRGGNLRKTWLCREKGLSPETARRIWEYWRVAPPPVQFVNSGDIYMEANIESRPVNRGDVLILYSVYLVARRKEEVALQSNIR